MYSARSGDDATDTVAQAAEGNIEQVLEYEIERQLPFRREEIYYDYLPAGKKGEKLSLYIVAVQKKLVDGLVDLLESFGIKPAGVEPDVTALLNYLLFAAGPKTSRTALLVSGEQSWDMLGVETKASSWNSSHHLLFSHHFPHSEWAQGASRSCYYKIWPMSTPVFVGASTRRGWFTGRKVRCRRGSPFIGQLSFKRFQDACT
jgi:hypothetical protein